MPQDRPAKNSRQSQSENTKLNLQIGITSTLLFPRGLHSERGTPVDPSLVKLPCLS